MSFALWHSVGVAPASRGVTLNLEREQVSEGGRNKGPASGDVQTIGEAWRTVKLHYFPLESSPAGMRGSSAEQALS